jgi:1-deoxy-D-xylulose-5-phosphate synthase
MAGIPDAYVEHGNVDLLKKEIGLDAVSITEKILEKL